MTEFPNTRGTLLAAVKSPENRLAWEEFVLLYRPVIYRMARRRGMQDSDAQDVTQDVLMRIAGSIERFELNQETRFRYWLRRVAKNAILNAIAKRPRDPAAGGTVAKDLLDEQPAVSPELEKELENEFQREQFLRAAKVVRSDVHPETWRAFELTVIQGLTCDEVAVSLGKSVGTVYAARSRIVKRLRDQVLVSEGINDDE